MRSNFYRGYCTVCGQWTRFLNVSKSIRETYRCDNCKASLRERVLAEAIISIYGKGQCDNIRSLANENETFIDLQILHPGLIGAIRNEISSLKGYYQSNYWLGTSPKEGKVIVPHQDLMSLTLESNSFDLVITSDIMEHIRKPWLAFTEIKRILRMGGSHIFTVSSIAPLRKKTIMHVDTSSGSDVLISEPMYHGDGQGGKSLLYTTFGADMISSLEEIGFLTHVIRGDHTNAERQRVISFVSRLVHH